MKDNSLPISVKAVLVRNNDGASSVLLLRNDRHEWELPGGRMHDNETPEECLFREVKEETGLTPMITSCIGNGILTIQPPSVPTARSVWIAAYGCRLPDNAHGQASITLSHEHSHAAWVKMSDIHTLADLPDTYKTLVIKWYRELSIRTRESAYTLPNRDRVTDEQLYLYDLQGFVVVRNALEAHRLEDLRKSVHNQFAVPGREGRALLDVSFDKSWGPCWPFLIDNPVILPLLTSICAGTPKLDHAFTVRSTFGNKQARLHHQGYGMKGNGLFHFVENHTIVSGLVGVIYSLYDNDDRSGGFCCIPGSHKANFQTPEQYYCVFENPLALFVRVRAGDAIVFNEATTHGTTLAADGGIRHAIMLKYTPGWMHYRQPASCACPDALPATLNHLHDAGERNVDPEVLSTRQMQMLMPAYSRRRPSVSLAENEARAPHAA